MSKKSVVVAVTHERSALTFYRGYLKYLRESGWEVTLVAASDGNLAEFASSEGVAAIAIPMRREPSPLQDIFALVAWIKLLRRLRPSAVVAATPKASLLGTVAARFTCVPVRIYQMWGLRFETESGLRRQILRAAEIVTARSATQVICNSPSLANVAIESQIVGNRVPVVLGEGSSHGVDLELFSGSAVLPALDKETADFISFNRTKVIVGFIGRIHQDKGIDTLLAALDICQSDGKVDLACVVLGQNENDDLNRLLAQAKSRLDIHIVNELSDPRPFLNVFDILCLPSRREGFPNVVLEAAAMRVPAIVTDSTGTIDSVVNDVTGLVVETDNAVALAKALSRLASDAGLRKMLGNAARARVADSFSKHKIWDLQLNELNRSLSESFDDRWTR